MKATVTHLRNLHEFATDIDLQLLSCYVGNVPIHLYVGKQVTTYLNGIISTSTDQQQQGISIVKTGSYYTEKNTTAPASDAPAPVSASDAPGLGLFANNTNIPTTILFSF